VVTLKLTPRLQAIADKIIPGSAVADIGSDHAYIPVYLLVNHLAAHVIVSDSKKGPLAAASETLKLFNLTKVADLRLGDGLAVLQPWDKVDAVVIAGMGGETITAILDRGHQVLKPSTRLIIQAMTDSGLVRSWLVEHGYAIIEEDIAQEDDNFYEIIVARQGGSSYPGTDSRLLAMGPLLVANKHPLLRPMLEQRLKRMSQAAENAGRSQTAAAIKRARELAARIEILEEVLSWL